MKCHLMSLGWKVWETTEMEYKIRDILPTDSLELDQYEGNAKSLNAILSGLANSVFTNVMRCKTTKQSWDKLNIIYERASKVKESNLLTYTGQFESLKMKEEERFENDMSLQSYICFIDFYVLLNANL